MTEDIFDTIEGYEQLHEILKVLNKLMMECEEIYRLNPKVRLKINFNMETDKEFRKLKGVRTYSKKEIETCTECVDITFVSK